MHCVYGIIYVQSSSSSPNHLLIEPKDLIRLALTRSTRRIRALLRLQLLLKLLKLLHRNLLLRVHNLLHTLNLLNIMHQHALNTILQRNSARIARPARAAQLQHNLPVDKPAELDVAAVLLDRGADAGFEELLDHGDDFLILRVVFGRFAEPALAVLFAIFLRDGVDDRMATRNSLSDQREDLWLDVRPGRGGVLGDGDVVAAVEDALDAVDVEEIGGEGRGVWRREGGARREVFEEGGGEVFGEDLVVGAEFEGVGIGGVFGLDEDCALCLRLVEEGCAIGGLQGGSLAVGEG
jgi:hypothetical protein